MVHKHNRPTVHDIRAMKARGQKLSMLYVTSLEEAAAAAAAGVDVLSIEAHHFTPAMREAAGRCFVQVGLPYGGQRNGWQGTPLTTAEEYLRAAYHFTQMGGDCFYCAASLEIQKVLCDNRIPVVAHVGLVPGHITWTGWRAVGKTAEEARRLYDQIRALEAIGCFGAELEVVPDKLGAYLSANTSLILLGMGAGPGADAQYLFAEDVLGATSGHKPRHARTYRNFAAEYARLQAERVAAFREFVADVATGEYPQPQHNVPMEEDAFQAFKAAIDR
jgi:3-methyl-2-oxobutanoate hydroxymethyltransferase